MKALLIGVIHCPSCNRALLRSFTSIGKVTLQHERTTECGNSGKSYEVPTVTLKEIKS